MLLYTVKILLLHVIYNFINKYCIKEDQLWTFFIKRKMLTNASGRVLVKKPNIIKWYWNYSIIDFLKIIILNMHLMASSYKCYII
jgi:hypothetical protein